MLKRYPLVDSRLYRLKTKRLLARLLGVELPVLLQVAAQKDNYRIFPIQKNGKTRIVEEPKPQLRKIHKRLADLLSRLSPPPYLHSGVKGRSYVTNGKAHVGNGPVITTDLSKFYPSTTHHHVFIGMLREFKCSGDVVKVIADLCTCDGHVPTGSAVSMLLCFYAHKQIFDQLYLRMESLGIALTVYVDDLTMSGVGLIRFHLCTVKKSFESVGLTCHKTRSFADRDPKIVTGTVITPNGLRLPHRRHRHIGEGINRLSEAVEGDDIQAISRRLLGQINEAAAVEERSRQRLPGLTSLVSRLSNGRDLRLHSGLTSPDSSPAQ